MNFNNMVRYQRTKKSGTLGERIEYIGDSGQDILVVCNGDEYWDDYDNTNIPDEWWSKPIREIRDKQSPQYGDYIEIELD